MRGGAEIEKEYAALVGRGAGQRHVAATGSAAEAFDLDVVAIEPQNAVQVAEAAGKVVVTDEGVLHFQTPLQHGLRECAAGVEVYAHLAARQNFGVEGLQEGHIDRAVQTEVELLRAGQMDAAVGGEIRSTSCQVESYRRQVRSATSKRMGPTLHLHVLDLDAERLESATP